MISDIVTKYEKVLEFLRPVLTLNFPKNIQNCPFLPITWKFFNQIEIGFE